MEQVLQTPSLNTLKNKDMALEGMSFIFPKGYEKIFLFLHVLILPYVAGLLFIFLYIAEANIVFFTSMVDDLSFFLTWCIGYELLMFIFLIGLILKSITIMRPKKEVLLQF
jgi:hypothetical protein